MTTKELLDEKHDAESYQYYCKNCCAWVDEDDAYTDTYENTECCPHCGCTLEDE